jgi:hypothetical protein
MNARVRAEFLRLCCYLSAAACFGYRQRRGYRLFIQDRGNAGEELPDANFHHDDESE